MDNLKHFKEIQYYGNTYKIGDEVLVLDHYTPKKKRIRDIFEDYYDDDSNWKCKWILADEGYPNSGGYYHLDEICSDEWEVQRKIEGKKRSYDAYVTRGY